MTLVDARSFFANPGGRVVAGQVRKIGEALKGIAAHHSVTTTPSPGATVDQELAILKEIERYHIGLGYGLFAYHMADFPSGRVYLVGDVDGQRSHVAGRNHELVGIVSIGTFTTTQPSSQQLAAKAEGIRYIRGQWGRYLPVRGHGLWALPGEGTACAGQYMNSLTPEAWDRLVSAGAPAGEEDRMNRYVALANPSFFRGLEISGRTDVWTNSPLQEDLHVPTEAREVLVTVYLQAGELDIQDGAGHKAGFCSGRHTTHRVKLNGEAAERPFFLQPTSPTATIDQIEILGWFA